MFHKISLKKCPSDYYNQFLCYQFILPSKVYILILMESYRIVIVRHMVDSRRSSIDCIVVYFFKVTVDFEPDYFISIKGISQLFGVTGTPLALKFALENGIILAVSHTYKNQSIYVNSDEVEQEEIELDCKGNILDNQCQLARYASIGIKAALLTENTNNIFGGVIYLQTTIPKNSFSCREAYVLAFCIATIMINKISHQFTLQKIFQNISKVSAGILHINSFSRFDNNEFQLTDNKLYKPLKISHENTEWKLFFADVLLSQNEENKLKSKNLNFSLEQEVGERMICSFLNIPYIPLHEIINYFNSDIVKIKQFVINYLPQECTKELTEKLTGKSICPQKQTYYPRRKLLYALEQFRLLSSLNSNLTQENIEAIIKDSYELLKEQQLINEDIENLIKFCIKNGALACTFTNEKFLVVMCQRKNLLGIFNLVRAKIFKGQNLDDKFKNGIQDLIFSTLPSKGIGILDPKTEIWF